MQTVRKGNWDFAKAILMFLVIYGHVCPAVSGASYAETWCALTRIIGLFVMPLFFFISGYFQSRIESWSGLINKYIKSLFRIIIPMLVWGGVMIIIQFEHYYQLIQSYGFISFVIRYIHDTVGFFWFLPALVLCILLGSILNFIYNKHNKFGIILIALSLPLFTLSRIELFHFSFMWFYYGSGMLYKFFEPKLRQKVNNGILIFVISVVTILCFILGYYFYPRDTFYFRSNCLFDTDLGFIIYRYILCFISSICVLYWFFLFYRRYKNYNIVNIVTISGQDTLFLYCSHVLILTFLVKPLCSTWLEGLVGNLLFFRYYFISPIIAIILYFLLYKILSVLKKMNIVRVLFMGLPANSR